MLHLLRQVCSMFKIKIRRYRKSITILYLETFSTMMLTIFSGCGCQIVINVHSRNPDSLYESHVFCLLLTLYNWICTKKCALFFRIFFLHCQSGFVIIRFYFRFTLSCLTFDKIGKRFLYVMCIEVSDFLS